MFTAAALRGLIASSHASRIEQLTSDPTLLDELLFVAVNGLKGRVGSKRCEGCGVAFSVPAARLSKARFCSVGCHRRWQSADPTRNTRRMTPERFWSRVDRTTDGCWLWQGTLSSFGYAEFARHRKAVFGHRYAYEITNGPIPPGMVVRHTCDTRACVRPDHLIIGTTADNQRDKAERGRSVRGERMWSAKLTDAQVIEARRLHATGSRVPALAKRYGINEGNMWKVVRGESWKHVGAELRP